MSGRLAARGGEAVQAFGLVARVPSPRFVAALGSALAVVLTLFSSFESFSAEDVLWLDVAAHLATDFFSLGAVLLVVGVAGRLVPARLFSEPPASRALAFSFGAYALAGLAGGAVRYHLRLLLGLAWEVAFPWELATNVGAGVIAFSAVGFLASQYYPFVERLDRLRALSVMAEEAAAIATHRDFHRRHQLATRPDEVGYLARTMNELLATVETTIQSHHDFLADTSHELRNPLLAIRANLELFDRVADAEARAECVREAVEQVERMSRLVSDLLTLARLESGQIVERRPVMLPPLVEDVVREAHKRADGQRITTVSTADVRVLGDEGRLRQVVANLVDNALRHTPPGGVITLRTVVDDGWARLIVADTGEGISPEHLPHIFERFYQVGKASPALAGGTGLGLAIVKHLCEAHGGWVDAESEPGLGSRFTVHLPLGVAADNVRVEYPGRPGWT